jgi:hypothetical protein
MSALPNVSNCRKNYVIPKYLLQHSDSGITGFCESLFDSWSLLCNALSIIYPTIIAPALPSKLHNSQDIMPASLPESDVHEPESQANTSAGLPLKRNFVWSDEQTDRLVEILYNNFSYQTALLSIRSSKEQERGQKVHKTTIYGNIFREIFGEDQPMQVQRIKNRIVTLSRIYKEEMAKMGETGAGLLWDDIQPGTEVSLR